MVIGAAAASARDCFIPMYTLNAPGSSNWFVVTAEQGASIGPDGEFGTGDITPCDAARMPGTPR